MRMVTLRSKIIAIQARGQEILMGMGGRGRLGNMKEVGWLQGGS